MSDSISDIHGDLIESQLPCLNQDECGSSDAMSVYVKEVDGENLYDAHCFSADCKRTFRHKELIESGYIDDNGIVGLDGFKARPKKEPITLQEYKGLISRTRCDIDYRGVKAKYMDFFGHRQEVDEHGNIIRIYYPETNRNYTGSVKSLIGYKTRTLPKIWGIGNIGKTGIKNDLAGMYKYKSAGKYVVIVGGELDLVSAYQMFDENMKGSKDYGAPHVVSPVAGEGSAIKQVVRNYDWLDRYEFIVLMLDNDKAGNDVTRKLCNVLPKEKILIAELSMKDPNEMLTHGKEKLFISDFYNAKPFYSSGIVASDDCYDDMIKTLCREAIPLPSWAWRLQSMTPKGAGIPLGAIVNIIGKTSIGKSVFVNRLVYHWIFNNPYEMAIITLELNKGEYLSAMSAIHLNKNIKNMPVEQALSYLQLDHVRSKIGELEKRPDGSPRFYLIDERDGSLDRLKEQIERLVKQYNCRVIIIDVLSDILRMYDNKIQDDFLSWMKFMVKEDVTFINVLHTKKNIEGDTVNEYDALGSSTFIQSAHINIVLDRDKMATDNVEKNTTSIDLPKCRDGETGHAGDLYFEKETQQLYDKIDYFSKGECEGLTNKLPVYGNNSSEDYCVNFDNGIKEDVF